MNAHSLLASAGINIGIALVVILTLFSLLKKQPSNAVIYYARRLSKQDRISFRPLFTLHRFIPSISWIRHALSVSVDEILQTRSRCSRRHPPLQVRVSIISLYGLYLLYERQASVMAKKNEHLKQRATSQNSGHLYVILGMIRGKIETIEKYEERLQELCYKIRCLQGENMLKQKELPVAFVSFKSRWGATLAAQTRQHVHPLLWVTHVAPEPRDVLWDNLYIPYRYLAGHKIGVFVAVTVFTVFFFAIPVTAVQGLVV